MGSMRAAVIALTLCAGSPALAEGWTLGVNGHPLVSYPGVSFAEQLDLVKAAGLSAYRVDVSSDDAPTQARFADLLAAARARGVTILPVLVPPVSLKTQTPEALRARAYAFANAYLKRFAGAAPVWELGNELENFAILRPCELRDDGSKYPCAWGPAGGVGADEYHGGRWAKVSAVLKGLSEGARDADSAAKLAIGTAGWGHVGAFDRLLADGVGWDVSVWHLYGETTDLAWALDHLARFGKPVWITEINADGGDAKGEAEQAATLERMLARIRALAPAGRVEAAFFYELLDEPYWSGVEAHMGAATLERDGAGGWRIGRRKPVFDVLRAAAGGQAAR
jgi:hypothetical protein